MTHDLLVRYNLLCFFFFFFSSRRRHTRLSGDWSSDVCSSIPQRVRIVTHRKRRGDHVDARSLQVLPTDRVELPLVFKPPQRPREDDLVQHDLFGLSHFPLYAPDLAILATNPRDLVKPKEGVTRQLDTPGPARQGCILPLWLHQAGRQTVLQLPAISYPAGLRDRDDAARAEHLPREVDRCPPRSVERVAQLSAPHHLRRWRLTRRGHQAQTRH